jgi:D-glycero-D-manno-heptose 1,7-bisphosphate phosphatase
VLNRVVVDPEHGTIDSPLHPDQVQMVPGAAEALATLCADGYALAIASNQPAAAKGKTTLENLEAVNAKVVAELERGGARIAGSYLCFHRAEDGCDCRKPKPGLLKQALAAHPDRDAAASWMVGDGVTDVQAGRRAGVRTAFLGPRKCDACKVFEELETTPQWWGADLAGFVAHLRGR